MAKSKKDHHEKPKHHVPETPRASLGSVSLYGGVGYGVSAKYGLQKGSSKVGSFGLGVSATHSISLEEDNGSVKFKSGQSLSAQIGPSVQSKSTYVDLVNSASASTTPNSGVEMTANSDLHLSSGLRFGSGFQFGFESRLNVSEADRRLSNPQTRERFRSLGDNFRRSLDTFEGI